MRLLAELALLGSVVSTVAGRTRRPASGGQASGFRVVHPDLDFRIVHHALFRRHLPGGEPAFDEHPAMDQHGVRHFVRSRNDHQVVRFGTQILFLVGVDGAGFRHCDRFSHQRCRRRFGQLVGFEIIADVESLEAIASHFPLAGNEGKSLVNGVSIQLLSSIRCTLMNFLRFA